MIEKFINDEVIKFKRHFIVSLLLILIIWAITFTMIDLLSISFIITAYIIYLLLKRLHNFLFWEEIKNKHENGLLEEFVNSEYESQKAILNNKRNHVSSVNIKGYKYNMQNSIFSMKNKHQKMKQLLQLKKLIENEKSSIDSIWDE